MLILSHGPRFGWAVLLLVLVFGPAIPVRAADIHVLAAASLSDALKVIGPEYTKRAGDKVSFSFGASSLLARQLMEGAPGDIFFSADERSMYAAEKQNLILPGARRDLLGNRLVIMVPSDSTLTFNSAAALAGPEFKRIALGDPASVPAGIYARKYLEKEGLWEKVQGKVVASANVRAALAAVESGDAEAGIVYSTDARISKHLRVAFEIPVSKESPIVYPVAVLRSAGDMEAARKFVAYLAEDSAAEVFRRFGFVVLPHAPR